MKLKSKNNFAVLIGLLIFMFSFTTVSAYENVDTDNLSMSFSANDKSVHVTEFVLDNGETIELRAEYVPTLTRSLNGTWRISGTNGAVTMVYYVTLSPSGTYTKISNYYGLSISTVFASFTNATLNLVRSTETYSLPAIVEGYAEFTYFSNAWVILFQGSGGVRTSVKNNNVTTSLY